MAKETGMISFLSLGRLLYLPWSLRGSAFGKGKKLYDSSRRNVGMNVTPLCVRIRLGAISSRAVAKVNEGERLGIKHYCTSTCLAALPQATCG